MWRFHLITCAKGLAHSAISSLLGRKGADDPWLAKALDGVGIFCGLQIPVTYNSSYGLFWRKERGSCLSGGVPEELTDVLYGSFQQS